jgi:nucleoside 2-deoxyribosyltransferase
MKVFIICSVRGASEEYKIKLENYVSKLEADGIEVHLPHRDTNQNARGYDICKQNANAIKEADEIHIFYSKESQGTHFDMGVSFALDKKIVIVENEIYGEGKSYPRMLDEWQNENKLGQKKVDDIIHCSKIEAMIILRLLKKRETEITEFTMEYHEIGHLIENYERILFN